MKCDICQENEATIHIQEVVNNNIKSMHICEKCAKNCGFNNDLIDIGFHLMGFLNNEKPSNSKNKIFDMKNKKKFINDESIIKCSQCSTSYDEFLESGKVGCAFCYIAFKDQIKPILRRIHGKTNHCGDAPEKYKKKLSLIRNVKILNHKLKSAVKKEEYESAANYRDKINELKEFLETPGD